MSINGKINTNGEAKQEQINGEISKTNNIDELTSIVTTSSKKRQESKCQSNFETSLYDNKINSFRNFNRINY